MEDISSAGTDWTYDPKAGFIATILQLSRSTVPHVLSRSEFWFLFGLHLMTWGAYQQGWFTVQNYIDSSVSVDWVDLKMLTVMSTFFLAFYINQCYGRYCQMYALTRKMFGAVHDFAYQARLFVRKGGKKDAVPYDRLASRWLAAATVLCFTELRNGSQMGVSQDQWRRLVTLGLIRKDEVDFLRGLGSQQRLLVILHYAGDVMRVALKDQQDATIASEVVGRILAYRDLHQELVDTLNLAIPFQYHHLLTGVVGGNLMFLAYGMGLTESFLAPSMFLLMALALMGMMDLSTQLWNPFGNDAVDFPVNAWVTECLAGLGAIMDYEHDGSLENWAHELKEEQEARTMLMVERNEVDILLGTYSRRWANLEAWTAPMSQAMIAQPSAAPGYQPLQQAELTEIVEKTAPAAGSSMPNTPNPQGKRPGPPAAMLGGARSALKSKGGSPDVSGRTPRGQGDLSMAAGEAGKQRTFAQEMEGLKNIIITPLNVLLVFVPLGFAAEHLGWSSGLIFGFNFMAIVPLAGLLGHSTEVLAIHTGQLIGGLLNATFGNAVEMIMCVQAIKAGLIRVVQGNLLGSVLSNLLLVLGMALFGAGVRFKDITFNAHGAQANMVCQLVASASICLPTMYRFLPDTTDEQVLTISRWSAVFLMITYFLFLFFQLKTHADFFVEEGEEHEEAEVSALTATLLLAFNTVLVAISSECLVGSIEEVSETYGLPKAFIGIILLPIVGNAAEHVTAVTCAMKGMMDLALGVAVGSCTQVSLFVVPCTVLFGWLFDTPMTLNFRSFDTVAQLLSVFIVQQVLANGHANWLHGSMLITTYLLIAVIVWHIPP